MLGLSDEGGALILTFSESWLQAGQEFMACLSECGPVWPQVLCSRRISSLIQEGLGPFSVVPPVVSLCDLMGGTVGISHSPGGNFSSLSFIGLCVSASSCASKFV